MTVLLVVATFAVILLIDHLIHRGEVRVASEARVDTPRVTRPLPEIVGGFEVKENLRYHPGHTWALNESPELVRVGLDDLAAKVAGRVDRISLPSRGQWIRQGQKVIGIHRNGNRVELVSPIEGTVVDFNEELAENPGLALKDPYGDGWLLKVNAPDFKTNFRNLLGGAVARRWMDEASSRLKALAMAPGVAAAVPVAQDGGVAVDDITAHLPGADWERLGREFFLS